MNEAEKKRVEEIERHHDHGVHCDQKDERCFLLAMVKSLEGEASSLRSALETYADSKNWDDGGFKREEAKVIFCDPQWNPACYH